MKKQKTDIVIVGAGPVGLMCAYLAKLCNLKVLIIDKSTGPLVVGRADALNARTLQLLELVNLFDELYPLGKTCNTSSVWSKGQFVSRQSTWWDELPGCLHKHFLMLGQPFVEKLLDRKLNEFGNPVKRQMEVKDIQLTSHGVATELSSGEIIHSKYLIGTDGAHSFVRKHLKIAFPINRPELIWAVIDGVIDTDFPKVPEIISFQNETSDVAWIPREGKIDRFYVRMDKNDFTLEDAIHKINRAMSPHQLKFIEVEWFSKFAVKESVAEKFLVHDRIFLAGDASHVHSVNGGQGLNTGIGDAFNLIWKLNMVINFNFPIEFLKTYEEERRPVALSVVESSGELVRSTKYSENNTHAKDYVDIVRKRAGNITGMGIEYSKEKTRLFDMEIFFGEEKKRLYSILDYAHYTLLIFGDVEHSHTKVPEYVKIIRIHSRKVEDGFWAKNCCYENKALLVRPDSYIEPGNWNWYGLQI